MVYSTIEHRVMTQTELMSICGELQIAKNYGQTSVKVELADNTVVEVPTIRLKEYQGAFRTITGAIKM